jgi:serine/threonine-protein kinase
MDVGFGEYLVSWRDITYQKIGNLGAGGSSNTHLMTATMGVYQGIPFAVKVFRALEKEEWRLNFMREVHFLRSCDHPAIMRVFDEGIYKDNIPFVVMEYLTETLSRALRKKKLADTEKLSLIIQLISALKYLARLDPPVVHRDIKPSNIFLKSDACILGDFGLLLPFDVSTPANARRKGKSNAPEMARNYRTPELVEYSRGGGRPPPKSDLFQLGLVAAEVFTGKNPLLHDSPRSPIRLEDVADVDGPLGAPIRALIQKMLIPDTDQRPSASDVIGEWQELYLEALRRQDAAQQAARWRK